MKNFDSLTIIRGALARPSGNEDDPWQRVILQSVTGKSDIEIAPGAQVTAELTRFTLTGVGTYEVTRPTDGPLAGKSALVTGAAGAIGAGICRALIEKGCHVAACDIAAEPLRSLAGEIKVLPVTMDVTDKQSVADGFAQVTGTWGGVDIVVVNAGIAMVAPLMELDVEAFRRLERVNVDGTLLTLAEAGRVLKQQGTGGDIILISTKNVFAPGAQFGAYSATKAASHQLARIASLEFAPFDVRVNMVAPDAVFSDGARRSGLWAEVGPSRMKARGLDEQGLEEYYRNRNLLKARVTAKHVANAVLFFATRQTPTTGATIPVDGGLPDATPR
jgi:NAD(P)-dependent dehydrogenase (short-subunit alcohol dehydrogenase family)